MSNIIDLDEYRKRRIDDKTWPLTGLEHREYWKKRKEEKDAREVPPPPPPRRGPSKKWSAPREKLESRRLHDYVDALVEKIEKDRGQYLDDRAKALWGEFNNPDVGEDDETADYYKNHPGWPDDPAHP